MINIDIRLTKIFKELSHSFKICTIHRNKCIMLPLRLLNDQLAAFQMSEGCRYTIHQNHLHRLTSILQCQPQTKQGTNRIPIRADVGSDDNFLCSLQACLDCPYDRIIHLLLSSIYFLHAVQPESFRYDRHFQELHPNGSGCAGRRVVQCVRQESA